MEFNFYEKQIFAVRECGLVYGNLLDGDSLSGAKGFYSDGTFFYLDVSNLWDGGSHRAGIQIFKGASGPMAGEYLHGRHLFYGVYDRVFVEPAANLSVGLQPGGFEL